jgi:alpha-L-fucosidase
MKHIILTYTFLSFFLYAFSKKVAAPKPYGVLPSERVLAWHETEFYGLVCFTTTTFQDKEWGYGDADPSILNPSAFDANQVASAAKSAGMNGLILVCKHHDGFCLWPTKTTEYNISKSPWKDGKGDMVREFSLACKKAGLKFGAYVSPWDRNSAEYGNPKYVEIYREQLREIYTNYGPLFISWHDGANGGDGYYGGTRETRKIDRTTYYGWDKLWGMTRELQPGAAIFSDIGWDVRWVGNEKGFAGETCWATFTPKGREVESKPGIGDSRYEEGETGHRDGKFWMPAECDVPLRKGWFYHQNEGKEVKPATQLFDLYCKSVGRGQCLDLGLAPDLRGILHEDDVASLINLGKLMGNTFARNLVKEGKITLSNIRGNDSQTYGAKNLLDNDRYSYWATDDKVKTPELILEFKNAISFNLIRIRENIKLGQRIDQIGVDVWANGNWKEVGQATSIGALRIIRLVNMETSTKVRLRIVNSAAAPCISEFGIYATPSVQSAGI